MPFDITIGLWPTPAAFLAGGVVLGLLAEKPGLRLLLKAARKIHFDSVSILINSLRGMVFLWVFLASLSGALTSTPLKSEPAQFFGHIPRILFLFSLTVVLARVAAGFFNMYASTPAGSRLPPWRGPGRNGRGQEGPRTEDPLLRILASRPLTFKTSWQWKNSRRAILSLTNL